MSDDDYSLHYPECKENLTGHLDFSVILSLLFFPFSSPVVLLHSCSSVFTIIVFMLWFGSSNIIVKWLSYILT